MDPIQPNLFPDPQLELLACPGLEQSLFFLLRQLPEELLGVIGNRLPQGDQLAARMVSKRWCSLMRTAVTHVSITPHQLASDSPAQASPANSQQQQQQQGSGRVLRPRAPPPNPPGRDQPPECLCPPMEFARLAQTFPATKSVRIRLLSRHGQRGEGVNPQLPRVVEMFAALETIAQRHAARLRGQAPLTQAALSARSSKPPEGLHVSLEVDVDVPRRRHQQAHATALDLLNTAWTSLTRLRGGLTSLSLHYYDPSIACSPALSQCFEGLSGQTLTRLKMGLTPGCLLPSLAGLQGLTSLQCTVGEDLHMADLQVPRYTEISVLSCLTRLSCIKLGGWACEVTLANALQQLSQLSSLELGEDLGSLQGLPLNVLTRLTALTIPTSLPVNSNMCDAALQGSPSKSAHAPPPSRHTATAPTLTLPHLAVLCAPPPLARVHDGSSSSSNSSSDSSRFDRGPCSQRAPISDGVDGVQGLACIRAGQEQSLEGSAHEAAVLPRGAARRRARWPQLIVPRLHQLGMDLGQQQRPVQAQETWPSAMAIDHSSYGMSCEGGAQLQGLAAEASAADLGPSLRQLSRLQCRLQSDPMALDPIFGALAAHAVPNLQDLELLVTRPSLLPPASLLAQHADKLHTCAASRVFSRLRSLRLTALWDGLVPEGYTDYLTQGAFGGGKPAALQPSGMLPRKHLGFLSSAPLLLPALTHLHLTTDRFRVDLCPPSLTCLVLEGVVRLDPLQTAPNTLTTPPPPESPSHHIQQPQQGRSPLPLVTPRLQHLSVVLARHPREVVHAGACSAAAGKAGAAPGAAAALQPQQQQPQPQQQQAMVQRVPQFCVLDTLAPLMGPALSYLSYTATPGPQVASRMEALTPSDYGISQLVSLHHTPISSTSSSTTTPQGHQQQQHQYHHQRNQQQQHQQQEQGRASHLQDHIGAHSTSGGGIGGDGGSGDGGGGTQRGRLRGLRSLGLYVMPRVAPLLDCAQLTPLSELHSLRTLSLDSPLTGATRLARLTQLSCLSSITELVTGKLDNEAYTGRLSLGYMSADQRASALSWASTLVAQRFGALPLPCPPPSNQQQPPASSSSAAAAGAAGTAAEGVNMHGVAAATQGAAVEGGGPVHAVEDEGASALQGSDDDVNSDDLLYETGEEEEESGGVDTLGAWDDED